MRFRPDPTFRQQLEAEAEFQGGMARITVEVSEAIKTAAAPFRHTGHYIGSIEPRATRVYLEPHFAHIIEYGSINNSPQANVRRGVAAAGLRFEDSRAALT